MKKHLRIKRFLASLLLSATFFTNIINTSVFADISTNTNEEVIMTIEDSGFSATGRWDNSGLTDNNTPSKFSNLQLVAAEDGVTTTAKWEKQMVAGEYTVSVWYPAHSTNTTDAEYIITHANGQATININQKTNGDSWVSLGKYYFAGHEGEGVSLTVENAGEYRVSAVKFTPEAGALVTLDDEGFSTTGRWDDSGLPGYYNTPSKFSNQLVAAESGAITTANWETQLAIGDYTVSVWYPANSGNATNAEYTILHDGGSSNVVIDQTTYGDSWVSLGNYTFNNSPAKVTLTVNNTVNDTGNYRINAVKFSPVPDEIITVVDCELFDSIEADQYDCFEDLELPTHASVTYSDNNVGLVEVRWEKDDFDGKIATNQTISGKFYDDEWLTGINAVIDVDVLPLDSDEVLILDTTSNTYSELGTWATLGKVKNESITTPELLGYNNTNSRFCSSGSGGEALWIGGLTENKYEVFVYVPDHPTNSTDATYEIYHVNGKNTVTINQLEKGDQWISLGSYEFSGTDGDVVKLLVNNDTKVYRADAIKYKLDSEIIVDLKDAAFTSSGNWIDSGLKGYKDTATKYSNSSYPGATATWKPVLAQKEYSVAVWYPANSSNTDNADYIITHANGVDTININQKINGNNWVKLGKFNFNGDKGEGVSLSAENTGDYRINAIKFTRVNVTPQEGTIVTLDDVDFSVTGRWDDSWLKGYNDAATKYSNTGLGNDISASWEALLEDHMYRVAVWYPEHTINTTDAKYTITHAYGQDTVTVNQKQYGDGWLTLGIYDFKDTDRAKVSLDVESEGTYRISALQFEQTTGETVQAVESLNSLDVAYNTAVEMLQLPTALEITFESGAKGLVDVNWDTSNYNGTQVGKITLTGTIEIGYGMSNPLNIQAFIDVRVYEEGANLYDFPANPLEKKGWTLDVHDEFNSDTLNEDLWLDKYLEWRTTTEKSQANYKFEDGSIVLYIDENTPNYRAPGGINPYVWASGIQTGDKDYLHLDDLYQSIEEDIRYAPRYGYFEVRAKSYDTGGKGGHNAFWSVGIRNEPWQELEFDISEHFSYMETGTKVNVYTWDDHNAESVTEAIDIGRDLTEGYNIFAVEWLPDEPVKFYINNELVLTYEGYSPEYAMVFFLTLYQYDVMEPYYSEYIVDYFRAYKRAPEYLTEDQFRVVESVDSQDTIIVPLGTEMANINMPSSVKTFFTEGGEIGRLDIADWSCPEYDANTPGEYDFVGTLTLKPDVRNDENITTSIKVVVSDN